MSYTRLRYHFVTSTKYRDDLLRPEVEPTVDRAFRAAADELNSRVLRVGAADDHVHWIAAVHPSVAVADFVRDLKTESSKEIKRVHGELAEFCWQRGYGGLTLYPGDLELALHYVSHQREHHAGGDIWDHFERAS